MEQRKKIEHSLQSKLTKRSNCKFRHPLPFRQLSRSIDYGAVRMFRVQTPVQIQPHQTLRKAN